MVSRVVATDAALALIAELKAQFGELIFHQSGGCCDGSAPMCFQKGDFKIGYTDVGMGKIDDCEFWMSKDQYEYWQHTRLIIDVVNGRGSSFSLEIPTGRRFLTRSELFKEEELGNLTPLFYKED